MKNDFCLLKKGTEIVLDNGIKTTIASNELLKEDFSYKWSEDDERVISTITDEYGDHYAILDLEKLTPEDIDWTNDSIFVPKEDCKVNRYQDVYLSDVELPREIGELDRESLRKCEIAFVLVVSILVISIMSFLLIETLLWQRLRISMRNKNRSMVIRWMNIYRVRNLQILS